MARSLSTVGVVGSGAMGAGIAQSAITSGFQCVLYDLDTKALTKAREDIAARLKRLVEKGQMTADKADAALASLKLASGLQDFAPADIVIEAIIERLEPKQELFKALEGVVAADAILASNTSSLSIAAIARTCKDRSRVCGLHFFNPVPLMQLVEVIRAPASSDSAVAMATELVKRFGKTPVDVKDTPGFLVNLAGRAYATEPQQVLLEGVADVATIDRIMRDGVGFRMGPFELMDLTGIDVNFPATTFMYHGFQNDPRIKTTILQEGLFNAGLFGRKAGAGWHSYADTAAKPAPAAATSAPNPQGLQAVVAEPHSGFEKLAQSHGLRIANDGKAPILISPKGEDAATAAVRLGLDPARVVAVDFTALDRKFLTIMKPIGPSAAIEAVEAWLTSQGFAVAVVKDSPGFVALRILSMIANLGCELAQIGIGKPKDIDLGMRLGMNYPRGPLEWADYLGPRTVLETLTNLQAVTGSDRYRPSLWLRRRAQLGLSIHTPD